MYTYFFLQILNIISVKLVLTDLVYPDWSTMTRPGITEKDGLVVEMLKVEKMLHKVNLAF